MNTNSEFKERNFLFNFVSLLEGPVTPLVYLHLSNLSRNPINRVCIMTNNSNFELLNKECKQLGIKLCLHASDSILTYYQLKNTNDNVKDSPESFFSKKFAYITVLKWILLIEVLKHDDNSPIIFTDSDIFWNVNCKSKNSILNNLLIENEFMTQQDGKVYCTGIMTLQKTDKNFELINNLLDYHLSQLSSKTLNDQDIFNDYVKKNNLQINYLPSNLFLIGRDISKSLTKLSNLNTPIAIHANYIVGHKAKFKVLNLIKIYLEDNANNTFLFKIKLLFLLFWEQKIIVKVRSFLFFIKHI